MWHAAKHGTLSETSSKIKKKNKSSASSYLIAYEEPTFEINLQTISSTNLDFITCSWEKETTC